MERCLESLSSPPKPQRVVHETSYGVLPLCINQSEERFCSTKQHFLPGQVPCSGPNDSLQHFLPGITPSNGPYPKPFEIKIPSPFLKQRLNRSEFETTQTGNSSVPAGSQSSIDMEGLLVDQAIGNVMTLSDALREVSSMQKGQCDELKKHEIVLKLLEEEIEKARMKNENIQKEMDITIRKMCVVDEDKYKLENCCKDIETEIRNLISEISKSQQKEREVQEEIDRERRVFDEYREKMEKHERIVEEYRHSLPVYQEYIKLSGELELLRKGAAKAETKSVDTVLETEMESENKEKKSNRETVSIEGQLKKLTEEARNIDAMIQEKQNNQISLDQKVLVLQKKNSAQLIRLKRQMKEVGFRNKRWHDQVSNLQQTISYIQKQLSSSEKK